MTIGIALFGAGRIGRVHAANVAAHEDAVLRWVCDPDEAAATALAGRVGARAATVAEPALDDPAVDAVIVASATPSHLNLTVRAVAAGKRVLCEKPLALDIEEIDAAAGQIDQGSVMVGFNRRFDPNIAELRRRIIAGEIGMLEQLTIVNRDPVPPSAAYRATAGGLFRDLTIHDLDLARLFLGDLESVAAIGHTLADRAVPGATVTVSARGEATAAGEIDSAVLILRNRAGTQCQILNARHCSYGYDQRIEAFGALGALRMGNQRESTVSLHAGTVTGALGPVQDFFLTRYAAAYRAELAAFLRLIAGSGEPVPGFIDGRAALVAAVAAERSVAERRLVTIGGQP